MKKLLKISGVLVLVILLFFPFINVMQMNNKQSAIVDKYYNQQKVYFSLGNLYSGEKGNVALTVEQQKALEKEFGKQIKLDVDQFTDLSLFNEKELVDIYGAEDNEDVSVTDTAEFIEGKPAVKKGEVIFNEEALKIAGLPTNLKELNQNKIIKDAGYTVSGIYKNEGILKLNYNKSYEYSTIGNGFYGKMINKSETSTKEQIESWNQTTDHFGNNTGKVIYAEEPSEVNGYEPKIDYKKSVENGAKDLIDPAKAVEIYGEKPLRTGIVTLEDEADAEKTIAKIKEIVPTAEFAIPEMGHMKLDQKFIIVMAILSGLIILLLIKLSKPIKMK